MNDSIDPMRESLVEITAVAYVAFLQAKPIDRIGSRQFLYSPKAFGRTIVKIIKNKKPMSLLKEY